MMRKYAPLLDHLDKTKGPVDLTFGEVSRLVGGLPPSAYRHAAWWSNSDRGHVQAEAWLRAGRRVARIDLVGERVLFSPLVR
jgi:hypothetical protein